MNYVLVIVSIRMFLNKDITINNKLIKSNNGNEYTKNRMINELYIEYTELNVNDKFQTYDEIVNSEN